MKIYINKRIDISSINFDVLRETTGLEIAQIIDEAILKELRMLSIRPKDINNFNDHDLISLQNFFKNRIIHMFNYILEKHCP